MFERMHEAIRRKNYSYQTERSYRNWVKSFMRYCGGRHPAELGEPEISAFLSYLAVERTVAASTQLKNIDRAKRPGGCGHSNVRTTMIYMHVLNKGSRAVRSPLD